MSGRLKELHAHDALFLLKHCLSIPRLTYFLRCSPCYKNGILDRYDELIKETLKAILNVKLEEEAWIQSTLPVASGGLGIRKAKDIAPSAFLASAHGASVGMLNLLPERMSTEDSIYKPLEEAESFWMETTNNALQPENPSVQACWDAPVYEGKLKSLLDSQTIPSEKARLRAVSSPHSSDWLNCIPMKDCGLRLNDKSLRICVALRLGSQICQPHNCTSCGELVSKNGRHGLSCSRAKGTHPRHKMGNDVVKRALDKAGYPSILEPTNLSRTDGKRPDGLTMVPWTRGQNLLWDFTCRDTLCSSNNCKTSQQAGQAANIAEKEKEGHYQELSRDFFFTPVASETLGSWGESSLVFLKDLGSRVAGVTGDKRETSWLFQRLSIAIQRGNAISISATIPSPKQLDLFDPV